MHKEPCGPPPVMGITCANKPCAHSTNVKRSNSLFIIPLSRNIRIVYKYIKTKQKNYLVHIFLYPQPVFRPHSTPFHHKSHAEKLFFNQKQFIFHILSLNDMIYILRSRNNIIPFNVTRLFPLCNFFTLRVPGTPIISCYQKCNVAKWQCILVLEIPPCKRALCAGRRGLGGV